MKTTTKLLGIVIAVSLFISSTAKAQTPMTTTSMDTWSGMGWRLGFGISGGLFPSKSAMDYGLGADVRLQWDIAPRLSLTGTAGYTRLTPASDLLDAIDFIPVKGGLKMFPFKKMYVGGELGAGIFFGDTEETNFIYSGGVGFAFPNGLDIGARYEGYVNNSASTAYFKKTGQYALRIAYGFKL